MDLIAVVGLDRGVYRDALIAAAFGSAMVFYDTPPRMYSSAGLLFAESPTKWGKMLGVTKLIWYSYFPGYAQVPETRKAIAFSEVPTFPNVRKTIFHDDRALSLMLATEADPVRGLSRGYSVEGVSFGLFHHKAVLKTGNDHCGDGKHLIYSGDALANFRSGIVEPFVDGASVRVLIVGKTAWVLKYDSDDWRKNVRSTVTEIHPADHPSLMPRARTIAEKLGLDVVGIDFIGSDAEGWHLLEVNAYPGLEDIPTAQRGLQNLMCDFVKG